VQFHLLLRNTSTVSARYPYLNVEKVRNATHAQYTTDYRAPFVGGADHIVHPDLTLIALKYERKFTLVALGDRKFLVRGSDPTRIECTVGCYNSRPRQHTITITEDEIAEALGLELIDSAK
jgi:hypothetical protein